MSRPPLGDSALLIIFLSLLAPLPRAQEQETVDGQMRFDGSTPAPPGKSGGAAVSTPSPAQNPRPSANVAGGKRRFLRSRHLRSVAHVDADLGLPRESGAFAR